LKYYTEKDGNAYHVVFFLGDRCVAKTNVMGQEIGALIESYTNGIGEKIDTLPEGVSISRGAIVWKNK